MSYRLTPETGERLLAEFAEAAADLHEQRVRFTFGGTPPVSRKAESLKDFDQIFDGSQSREEILAYLRGEDLQATGAFTFPQKSTIERIRWKQPAHHTFAAPFWAANHTSCSLEGIQGASKRGERNLAGSTGRTEIFHPGQTTCPGLRRGACPQRRGLPPALSGIPRGEFP